MEWWLHAGDQPRTADRGRLGYRTGGGMGVGDRGGGGG